MLDSNSFGALHSSAGTSVYSSRQSRNQAASVVPFTLHSPHLCQPHLLLTSPPKRLSFPFISHHLLSHHLTTHELVFLHPLDLTSPLSVLFMEADCFLCLKTPVVSYYSLRTQTLSLDCCLASSHPMLVLAFHASGPTWAFCTLSTCPMLLPTTGPLHILFLLLLLLPLSFVSSCF